MVWHLITSLLFPTHCFRETVEPIIDRRIYLRTCRTCMMLFIKKSTHSIQKQAAPRVRVEVGTKTRVTKQKPLSVYTAFWIYEFTGLRLINYVSFYRYISHNLCAKRVYGDLIPSAYTENEIFFARAYCFCPRNLHAIHDMASKTHFRIDTSKGYFTIPSTWRKGSSTETTIDQMSWI